MEDTMSFFDDDLYKIKTCYAISQLYPEATAEFRFINRGKHTFLNGYCEELKHIVDQMEQPRVNYALLEWLKIQLPEIKEPFWKWLYSYHYDPHEVSIRYIPEIKDIEIIIKGNWMRVTLWEIKLMSLISELYYKYFYSEIKTLKLDRLNDKYLLLKKLSDYNIDFKLIEFGTRRRVSYEAQEKVIKTLSTFLTGTSNMYFAKEFNIPVKGTMPHEWIMGVSALDSLRYANKYALQKWAQIFPDPGIALSDTFGIDAFFEDFNVSLSKLYDGTRQDSGNPEEYILRTIQHYKTMGIDPSTKKIIFSDSLDFEEFPPLNIVIKPWAFNNIPVVKLGEGEGKISGDPKAIEYTKWVFRK